jgi:ubiquinone/menaquinone biosynthesis C-methylase UbiE
MSAPAYQPNPIRGPFNAFFFHTLDRTFDRLLGAHKRKVFADLPSSVVELGPGVGANLRYLPPQSTLIAVEPNPAMRGRLRAAAERHGVTVELHSVVGERIDLPDASTDAVISSLVLCSVTDPVAVLAEVRRVLRPGGRYAFVEHVAAPDSRFIRTVQRLVRRPWAWCFEGCSCERDLASVIDGAGFSSVDVESYRLRSLIVPFNPQIAGVAIN